MLLLNHHSDWGLRASGTAHHKSNLADSVVLDPFGPHRVLVRHEGLEGSEECLFLVRVRFESDGVPRKFVDVFQKLDDIHVVEFTLAHPYAEGTGGVVLGLESLPGFGRCSWI